MKFRLLMACVMGFITPTINARMAGESNPLPMIEDVSIDGYKTYSIALIERMRNDLETLIEEHLS